MGQTLDKPLTAKDFDHGSGQFLRFGVSGMQGWRIDMEDDHTSKIPWSEEFGDCSFFGVFDGHAGSLVSQTSAERLYTYVSSYLVRKNIKSIPKSASSPEIEEFRQALSEAFVSFDENLKTLMYNGGRITDTSGSTVLVVIVTPELIIFCNCGDSRGILVRDGKVHFATQDHKPSLKEEEERIENANGHVTMDRVNGNLAVSRAFGDFNFKKNPNLSPIKQQVSPEPTVTIIDRNNDELIVLACDGIWDVMSCDEVCEYVYLKMRLSQELEKISSSLIDTCLLKDSHDNMTAMIIALPDAPILSIEECEKDKEYEDNLKTAITDIYTKSEMKATLISIVKSLSAMEIGPECVSSKLGPIAKKDFIETVLKDICPDRDTSKDYKSATSVSSFPMALQAIQQLVNLDQSDIAFTEQPSPTQDSGAESSSGEIDFEGTPNP